MDTKITVRQEPSGWWEVWLALDKGDPLTQPCSFIIGLGPTKDAAKAAAVAELEAVVEFLQLPDIRDIHHAG